MQNVCGRALECIWFHFQPAELLRLQELGMSEEDQLKLALELSIQGVLWSGGHTRCVMEWRGALCRGGHTRCVMEWRAYKVCYGVARCVM